MTPKNYLYLQILIYSSYESINLQKNYATMQCEFAKILNKTIKNATTKKYFYTTFAQLSPFNLIYYNQI